MLKRSEHSKLRQRNFRKDARDVVLELILGIRICRLLFRHRDLAILFGLELWISSLISAKYGGILRKTRRVCQQSTAASSINSWPDRICPLSIHCGPRSSWPIAKVARWQNLIPSFPWIAPGWRAWERNPRKGRDQTLQRSLAEP